MELSRTQADRHAVTRKRYPKGAPGMKSEGLTSKQVQFMKPNPRRRLEVPAGPPAGLYLVVQSSGGKSWAFRYRWRGRTRKLTFPQTYPDMSLAAARAEAESKLAELARDIDPAAVQVEEQAAAAPNSVNAVAEEWLARHVDPNTRSLGEWERILNHDVLPAWRDRYINEIGRPDVLRLLDAIVYRGAPIVANRTFEVIRALFNWCLDRGYVTASPTAGIKAPSVEHSRDRI